MAHIRSSGNASTELRLVALLRAAGITGWRRGQRLPLPRQSDECRVQNVAGRGTREAERLRRPASKAQSISGIGPGGSVSATSVSSVVQIRLPSSAIRRPLIVKPDFVFRTECLAVFVDGCF